MEKILKDYDFLLNETGGGCTAYINKNEDKEIYVTKHGDTSAPEQLTDKIDVGEYDEGELVGEIKTYSSVTSYLSTRKKFLATWGNWEDGACSYEPCTEKKNENFFNAEQGYTDTEAKQINELETGEEWHSELGNHIVKRIK